MMKAADTTAIEEVAKRFTEGYTDHGFCILSQELREMGLKVEQLEGEQLDLVWSLHLLEQRQRALVEAQKKRDVDERLRNLPPELVQDSEGSDE